ncbi:MAG TPA: hypothetical protein VKA46_18245 [Gemmataceae bacterium]|nr:hypothetical protein [Gemmataceae bacterium]
MSMVKPRIYADFHNADSQGRIRLNCIGTIEDLAQQQVPLREGLVLTLYADDLDDKGQLDELLADGVVSFSEAEHCWVAAIDWGAIRHASDGQGRPPTATGLLAHRRPDGPSE